VRSFRTADACKALKAIADENDLSKTTLQHIKGVLGGIFTHAKNEGAFDGANPVQEARIPSNAREPAETYAYKLTEICSILELRGWNGMAGTAFAVASRRICMNWGRTRRSFNASKSHVTKDRYLKAFDPAVLAAMKKLEASLDVVNQSAPRVHRIN